MATDVGEALPHLRRHHGDFETFRDLMIQTSKRRFGPLWWGVWDEHLRLPAKPTVVDLGAGPGGLLPGLRQRLPDARLLAVEIQPAMLASLYPTAEKVGAEVIEADIGQPLPLEPGSVDAITAVMVMHELVYPPALLEQAVSLLRPGGTLFLYDWVKQPLDRYLGGHPLTPDLLQHFREHCLFTAADLGWLCECAGLRIQETIGRRGGGFAMIVAQRPGSE